MRNPGSAISDWFNSDCQGKPRPPGLRKWIDYDHTIWLVFVGFWFLSPYLDQTSRGRWLGLILVVVLFIPSYLFAHSGPRRLRWVGVLAMFVLGVVYVPFNPSAWGRGCWRLPDPGLVRKSTPVHVRETCR